jgi:Ca2+/H+ antiporter, TMEM165/GDT1 family
MSVGTFFYIAVLMFLLELPDKTMIATVIMSTRARASSVAIGAAVGFVVQMALAVAAGSLLFLLPHRIKDVVVALLFLGGAAYLLLVSEDEEAEKGTAEAEPERPASRLREMTTAFTVIFVSEFGDLTQIQAANFSAKFHQPLAVFGATSLGMVAVTILGAYGGTALQRIVPLAKIRIFGGLVFAVLGVWTVVGLFR